MSKTEIVVDADVLIHFDEAQCLATLPLIFPYYEYVILSTVYEEARSLRKKIDNICMRMKTMSIKEFNPTGPMLREYAMLKQRFGRGESACMAYCKYTNNVVGSSNLRDIRDYCTRNKITYLTTLDFFYYAWKRGKMSLEDVNEALRMIVAKGSKLPLKDITRYIPSVTL